MLALQIATHGAVMPALQPALQLRGGMSLGGVDETQIATGLTALLGVQGLMMYQNTEKSLEMYELPSTGVTKFFAEQAGALMLGCAIIGWSTLNGGDAAEAAGYGNIPGLLLRLKNLVDAFELAVSQGLKADLVLAGPHGWQSRRIREACARRTRLQGRLHLPGFVPAEDLPKLMSGACGFVHPARHEGTGMTAMEAMAAGTPVLCSNRGALPEVTAGAALLFEPNDPASIARTLHQNEDDAELRARMRAQGLARSADLTWDSSAQQTLEAYRLAMRLPA